MERSMMAWNLPDLPALRVALRATLAGIGCTRLWVKAGGDDGYAWIPNEPLRPDWAHPQWSDWLDELAPLDCQPWFYIWPRPSEYAAIVRALRHRMADEIVLNAEVEWRVQSPQNGFRNLADANAQAMAWVDHLRAVLMGTFGREFRIGYSAVPSWADFPYEGFDHACDFAMPQDYWPDNLMPADGEEGAEAGEDQVEAHLRRVGKAKPCIPTLTVAKEYDDATAYAMAVDATMDYPEIAGFSGWVCGEYPFQSEVMRRAYLLLPADHLLTVDWPSPFIALLGRQLA